MTLSNDKKKHFRSIGHGLKPTVTIAAKGFTENVAAELNRALDDHELVKVKLAIENRDDRKLITEEVVKNSRAELVQTIGKMILLYREAQKPKLKTSVVR